jgi:hypothetical protein
VSKNKIIPIMKPRNMNEICLRRKHVFTSVRKDLFLYHIPVFILQIKLINFNSIPMLQSGKEFVFVLV